MENWDVIIVGAGYGGLCAGALLAHRGKKVLVLEKEGLIGGRSGSVTHEGQILDDGAHIPAAVGHLEGIFEVLGLPYPEKLTLNNSEIYDEGEWKRAKDLFTVDQYKAVFSNIMKLTPDEMADMDDLPLSQWVAGITDDPGIRKLFFYLGCSTSVGNRFETYSAGEMIYIIREVLDSGGRLSDIAGVIQGGMNAVLQPLVDYINSHGGEVRLNAPAESVVIKNDQAVGVNVEVGKRVFHGQTLDLETLNADWVIVTAPLWDVFSVLDEADFPTWWVDWVRWIGTKVSQAWSIVYGLDEPLFDMSVFRWAPDLPHSGFSGISFPMPGYGEAGQYQFHVSYQGHYDEMPDLLNRRSVRNRRRIRETLAMLEKESIELYPQLASGYRWRVAHAGVYGIAQSPGLVGTKRPPMRPPGVENLYLVSNTVQEARGISMSAVGKCARMAAEAICG